MADSHDYFKSISWDINLSEKETEELFSGKKNVIRGITTENIYVKLLSSYNWYTILKIADKEKLREMLTDDTIKKIKSKTLREKYFYAKSILF